jgi:CubicO group peptidase (beta-lactamase class C family)
MFRSHSLTVFTWLLVARTAVLCAAEPAPLIDRGALASAVQPFVDRQMIAGAVMLVADRERILDLEVVGHAELSTNTPMRPDTVFWLASMTKPFTATAVMMLVDEGKLSIDDPVEKYLPEFKGQQVAGSQKGGPPHPPKHPITIKELLSHTSGLIGPNDVPIKRPYVLAEDVVQYAAAPLKWEPGTKFEYNNSGINTAGRIIEVVSGMPYGDFVRTRLLEPLGMRDTTYWPSVEQGRRLAITSEFDPATGKLEDRTFKIDQSTFERSPDGRHVPYKILTYDGSAASIYAKRYAWPAGGLYSTASDVARFGQMLLNGGTLEGKRYLSQAAIRQMTSSQTGGASLGKEQTSGLGLFIKLNDHEGPSVGSFGHRGARGPVMWIDRENGLVMILLISSFDIQDRGEPKGSEQKALASSYFHAAVEKFGKTR